LQQAARAAVKTRATVSIRALLLLLLPLCMRLALLPWYPPPELRIHDEFAHVLAADTLLHGRLANPPHPFWKHFDTIYELQQPAYASKYPLGQGAFLALGQILTGEPWAGVWISCLLMVFALYWALLQWIHPSWALFGAAIACFRFCLATYWLESYMGGAVAAIGGALTIGALGRMLKGDLTKPALIMGAGLSLVWLTRPYETVLLGIAVVAVVVIQRRKELSRFIVPAGLTAAALIPAAALTLAHNWRVTGDAFKLPYVLSREQYGVPTTFYFQPPPPEPASFTHKVLKDKYESQNKVHALGQSRGFLWTVVYKGIRFWLFFLGVAGVVPLLYAGWAARNSAFWMMAAICVCVLAGELLYPFYFAHYSSVIAAAVLMLQTRGFQAFWEKRRYVLFFASLALLPVEITLRTTRLFPDSPLSLRKPLGRHEVAETLKQAGGKHVIFVRYAPGHDPIREWVYNGADIDSASVIWARELDPVSDSQFRAYYRDRSFWVVEADVSPPKLTPLSKP
jgi:hypothetical protein